MQIADPTVERTRAADKTFLDDPSFLAKFIHRFFTKLERVSDVYILKTSSIQLLYNNDNISNIVFSIHKVAITIKKCLENSERLFNDDISTDEAGTIHPPIFQKTYLKVHKTVPLEGNEMFMFSKILFINL